MTSVIIITVDAVIMSDDIHVYCNAWNQVMGPPTHHLLCTWHVHKAWHKNVHKIKRSVSVYKTVHTQTELADSQIFDN